MTYATQGDLEARFGHVEIVQLSDFQRLGAIDTDTVDRALSDADATINGYVAARYKVPLAPVPANIVKAAADLARFYLHRDSYTDAVKAAYDAAIALLKGVAAGTITLEAGNVESPAGGRQGIQVAAPEKLFTRDRLKGFTGG